MITMLYAGLCTLLVLVLAFRVVKARRQAQVGLGDGGHAGLQQAIRAHANAVENLPLALLLLGGIELNGFPDALVHVCGATLFLARVGHAWGLSNSGGRSRGRFYGTLTTWLIMGGLALLAIGGYLAGLGLGD